MQTEYDLSTGLGLPPPCLRCCPFCTHQAWSLAQPRLPGCYCLAPFWSLHGVSATAKLAALDHRQAVVHANSVLSGSVAALEVRFKDLADVQPRVNLRLQTGMRMRVPVCRRG